MRSNERTVWLWSEFLSYTRNESALGLDDQTLFWRFLRSWKQLTFLPLNKCSCGSGLDNNHTTSYSSGNTVVDLSSAKRGGSDQIGPPLDSTVVTCPLDACAFTNASPLMMEDVATNVSKHLKARNTPLYAVHANMFRGTVNKAKGLSRAGLWLMEATLPPQSNKKGVDKMVLGCRTLDESRIPFSVQ